MRWIDPAIVCIALTAALGVAAAVEITMLGEDDPFSDASCHAFKLRSSAPYVFKDWPATFDLIKWPEHDSSELLSCDVSGYASFPEDFTALSKAERDRIAPFLKKANFGAKIAAEKKGPTDAFLTHLEKIYDLRDKDEAFRAYLARYFASQYKDPLRKAAHQKIAFERHLKLLQTAKLKGSARLETLYVLGYYAWRLERDKDAARYFAELAESPAVTDNERTYKKYLQDLVTLINEGKADSPNSAFMQPPRKD